jgi:hypothetical protein
VLLEAPETLDAATVVECQAEAKAEAELPRPGLAIFTDGSRADSSAAGYAVAWQNGQRWVDTKTHMAYNQEAFDAERAALATALKVAARQQPTLESHNFYGRTGSHPAHGLGRARPWTEVCYPG